MISVGALDMVNFGPPETVPEKYKARRFHQHNPTVTLMRTTPEEMDRLGKEIAEKASAASGPTAVMLPLRGVSAIDAEGKSFWWPEADAALFQSVRNWIAPGVEVDRTRPAHQRPGLREGLRGEVVGDDGKVGCRHRAPPGQCRHQPIAETRP